MSARRLERYDGIKTKIMKFPLHPRLDQILAALEMCVCQDDWP